jgi:hypothetical protein
MRSLTILAVAVLVCGIRPAVGQGGVVRLDSNTVILLAPLQKRIARADKLRVKSEAGSSVLVLPRLVKSGLGYAALVGPAPDPAGQAFHLQIPGRATWTGAVIGGVVLGTAGAVLGARLSGVACIDAERPCSPPVVAYAVVLGLVGAVGGGGLGALVGAFIPTWRTIYRSPG